MKKYRGDQINRGRMRSALKARRHGQDVGETTSIAIGRRLAHVRSCTRVNQTTMARCLGITLHTWQNYEQGVRPPSAITLTALWQQLGINPIWVLTGMGAVVVDDDTPEVSSPTQANEWGSAGECPASSSAKTPAAGAQCFRVAGVGMQHDDGTISLCVNLQRPGGGVE